MNPYREALEGWTESQWTKGGYVSADGLKRCVLGRVGNLHGFLTEYSRRLGEIAQALFPDRIEPHGMELLAAQVNDHPDTTFADVQQILEKAAVQWDELNG